MIARLACVLVLSSAAPAFAQCIDTNTAPPEAHAAGYDCKTFQWGPGDTINNIDTTGTGVPGKKWYLGTNLVNGHATVPGDFSVTPGGQIVTKTSAPADHGLFVLNTCFAPAGSPVWTGGKFFQHGFYAKFVGEWNATGFPNVQTGFYGYDGDWYPRDPQGFDDGCPDPTGCYETDNPDAGAFGQAIATHSGGGTHQTNNNPNPLLHLPPTVETGSDSWGLLSTPRAATWYFNGATNGTPGTSTFAQDIGPPVGNPLALFNSKQCFGLESTSQYSLTLDSFTVWQPLPGRCGQLAANPTPPAPAAAAGYNTLIFCDDWPDLNSIDVQNVCNNQTAPGDCINPATGKPFKWFPFEGWPAVGRCSGPGGEGVNADIRCQTTPTATPNYFAVHPGGGLDFTASPPSVITAVNAPCPGAGCNPIGGAITSCRTNGQNNQYMGFVLPFASYFRVNLIHMPDPTPNDVMQPVLWADDIAFDAASANSGPPIPNPYVELDWIETGFGTGIAHLLEWDPNGAGQIIPGSAWGSWPTTTNIIFASLGIPMSLGTSALYASLGISLPNNTGSMYGYISDAIPPTGSNNPAVPTTWTAGGRFSEIENAHYCILLWTAQSTTSIASIEAWAAGSGPPPPPGPAGGGSPKWFRGH